MFVLPFTGAYAISAALPLFSCNPIVVLLVVDDCDHEVVVEWFVRTMMSTLPSMIHVAFNMR